MSKKVRFKKREKLSAQNIVAIVLFITLIASTVYSLIQFIIAPEELTDEIANQNVKSDYLLMLTQCLLGLVVMMLPPLFTHKLKVMVPSFMTILYYIFLYCSIFLGEIFQFYYNFPNWDLLLHAMSGAMLGILGFLVVDWLNKDERVKLSMNPFFVSLFAFSFALMIGALWEIYEFSFDKFLGLNMQKFAYHDGTLMMGREALSDTMEDIIIDALAAFSVSVLGFFTSIKRKNRVASDSAETSERNSPNL